ncbi:MAG: UDP-galactopyranose mutase [Dorea sp.]|nr:UDP-galactopyranose mutase [Dorea sp.]
MRYDYLIVGAGLFGSIFAYEAHKAGKKVLVVDRRGHVGGNIYTKETEGIQVHQYGAHIFHTSDQEVWDYVQQFAQFNRYTNSPVARYKDELYNLPFNMNTFSKMWGVSTPEEAKEIIERQIREAGITEPKNLEEQAISLVGRDIYEKLVKGYTEKQWGKRATELPSFIIRRLPVRFVYDNNYFNDKYQGIPVGGYTQMIEKMLEGIEVRLCTDFLEDREELASQADKIVFTGMIDAYYGYCYGELEYRSLRFETETLPIENYQGNAVVNYTEYEIPYTRIIEHKHFEFGCQGGYGNTGIPANQKTVITREYPAAWAKGDEPYYPMNDERNNALYEKYRRLADKEERVIFGGRLGMYRYYDMHQVVAEALKCVREHSFADSRQTV